MTRAEIQEVLRKHKMWRSGEAGGARANLAGADLAGANLADANLADANLADADLRGADLGGADLGGAKNLPTGTPATSPAEPYQRLSGEASRQRRMSRARVRHPDVPVIEDLDRRMLAAVTDGVGRLNMSTWHTCSTTHCRAGWAITMAGKAGADLEYKHGPYHAGRLIYLVSTGRVPHFFGSNEAALEDIKKCAEEGGS